MLILCYTKYIYVLEDLDETILPLKMFDVLQWSKSHLVVTLLIALHSPNV